MPFYLPTNRSCDIFDRTSNITEIEILSSKCILHCKQSTLCNEYRRVEKPLKKRWIYRGQKITFETFDAYVVCIFVDITWFSSEVPVLCKLQCYLAPKFLLLLSFSSFHHFWNQQLTQRFRIFRNVHGIANETALNEIERDNEHERQMERPRDREATV